MTKLKTLLLIVFALLIVIIIGVCAWPKAGSDQDLSVAYEEHKEQLKYFESGDGQMAYWDGGEGPVILLVHGVPTSSWLYRKIIPKLIKNGFRVIAPDMLGYGASDKPDDPEIYTADKMGQRLLRLMEHLNIEEWTQVFHDGGGLWTWEMLIQDASKVNHLVMLNTIVYEAGFKPPIRFKEGKVAEKYAKQYTTKMGQKMVINPTFKNGVLNKEVINDSMLQGYKIPYLDQSSASLYYFFTRTCNKIPNYTTLYQSLNIPLTVIWGEEDDMLVWKNIEELVKKNFDIKDENIHLLDAKHFIQEEKPKEISDIIVQELKGE